MPVPASVKTITSDYQKIADRMGTSADYQKNPLPEALEVLIQDIGRSDGSIEQATRTRLVDAAEGFIDEETGLVDHKKAFAAFQARKFSAATAEGMGSYAQGDLEGGPFPKLFKAYLLELHAEDKISFDFLINIKNIKFAYRTETGEDAGLCITYVNAEDAVGQWMVSITKNPSLPVAEREVTLFYPSALEHWVFDKRLPSEVQAPNESAASDVANTQVPSHILGTIGSQSIQALLSHVFTIDGHVNLAELGALNTWLTGGGLILPSTILHNLDGTTISKEGVKVEPPIPSNGTEVNFIAGATVPSPLHRSAEQVSPLPSTLTPRSRLRNVFLNGTAGFFLGAFIGGLAMIALVVASVLSGGIALPLTLSLMAGVLIGGAAILGLAVGGGVGVLKSKTTVDSNPVLADASRGVDHLVQSTTAFVPPLPMAVKTVTETPSETDSDTADLTGADEALVSSDSEASPFAKR